MSKHIIKAIPEMLREGLISEESADKIQSYYAGRADNAQKRIFVIFGILGAALVGLGIILIIGHNWDHLSRPLKTILAFIPLIAGQAFCALSLFRFKGKPGLAGRKCCVFIFCHWCLYRIDKPDLPYAWRNGQLYADVDVADIAPDICDAVISEFSAVFGRNMLVCLCAF